MIVSQEKPGVKRRKHDQQVHDQQAQEDQLRVKIKVVGPDLFEEFISYNQLGNRNMSKLKGWTLQGSLLMLWMDENLSQQSNKN